LLPWAHTVFGNPKTWLTRTFHGVSPKHLQRYLDEFVFRFDRRWRETELDAPKPGAGGKGTLFVDGQKVAEGHIPRTQPYAFSTDEGVDVGMDGETAVSRNYKQLDTKFTGRIVRVMIDVNPSQLSPAGAKAAEAVKEAAEIIED
jgi:hypothetical protein